MRSIILRRTKKARREQATRRADPQGSYLAYILSVYGAFCQYQVAEPRKGAND